MKTPVSLSRHLKSLSRPRSGVLAGLALLAAGCGDAAQSPPSTMVIPAASSTGTVLPPGVAPPVGTDGVATDPNLPATGTPTDPNAPPLPPGTPTTPGTAAPGNPAVAPGTATVDPTATDTGTTPPSPAEVPIPPPPPAVVDTVVEGVADGLSGVVVVDRETGSRACYPLCVTATTPDDATNPDWASENDVSCVIPGTVTGQNQTCTTGQTPLPEPVAKPGVIVTDGETGIRECISLCQVVTTSEDDGDWSYEDNDSCILPGTPTGLNQTCTTTQAVPAPLPKPGVVIVDNDNGGLRECIAICKTITKVAEDPDGDGWFWEDSGSCLIEDYIPDSIYAKNQACTTTQPVPPPLEKPGYQVSDEQCSPICSDAITEANDDSGAWAYEDNDSCIFVDGPGSPGQDIVDSAPACTVNSVDVIPVPSCNMIADGFYVSGAQLLDACGQPFVMRGVNNAHVWFDGSGKYTAYKALTRIASYGTNTIRVVWEANNEFDENSAALLRQILYRIVELKMIPMVELHDMTGKSDPDGPLRMAQYFTQSTADNNVLQVMQDFRAYVLINIANEWSGTNYVQGYTDAIQALRSAGLTHTLVIDGNNWGQNGQVILDSAQQLIDADTENNLLFSVHMYGEWGDANKVTQLFSDTKSRSIPLIVGEFGHAHSGQPVAWQTILSEGDAQGIGWLAWSWNGNDGADEPLNMVTNWDPKDTGLTSWGTNITNAIAASAAAASVF